MLIKRVLKTAVRDQLANNIIKKRNGCLFGLGNATGLQNACERWLNNPVVAVYGNLVK
jgi:phosphoribosylformylglycinamidine (FGAM) synthase PurS component